MTDITRHIADSEPRSHTNSSKLDNVCFVENGHHSPNEIVEFAELLFFAYRDFTSDPDAILAEFGFGRAHHRVLHFVYRNPGLRVADLLEILKITKQSLSRVLKQLVDQGYITQRAGKTDRRERLLFVTEKGRELASRLMDPQIARIAKALGAVNAETANAVRQFLYNMITDDERDSVASVLSRQPEKAAPKRHSR